ncbi:MAG: hypothetical protein ACXV3C_08470 [Actinomycetes bacterium]
MHEDERDTGGAAERTGELEDDRGAAVRRGVAGIMSLRRRGALQRAAAGNGATSHSGPVQAG